MRYRRNHETIVSYSDDLQTKINTIYDLIKLGAQDPRILKAAENCRDSDNVYQCALNFAYDSAVMQPSPEDRQQFRTVRNILKHKRANCTGYVTVIGSILYALGIPFTLRVSGVKDATNQIQWVHIYIISGGYVMDATIGQDQNGRANFVNRKINATFDKEFPSDHKKDFHFDMITVMNGRTNLNMDPATASMLTEILDGYKDENGKIDVYGLTQDVRHVIDLQAYSINTQMSLINQYLNPCKRGCDIRWITNMVMRRACKRACAREQLNNLSPQDLQQLLNMTSAQTSLLQNPNLIYIAAGLGAVYLFSRK